MKRKLTIALCVCLLAVLICMTCVSCKNKPAEPTYDEIYALMFGDESFARNVEFEYASYDLTKINDLVSSEEYAVEYKGNGIFFCKSATGIKVYSVVAGDFITEELSANVTFEAVSDNASEARFIIDTDNGVIYDYYGTKVIELGTFENVEGIKAEDFFVFVDTDGILDSLDYLKVVISVNVDETVEEKTFTVEYTNGIIKEANSVKDPYATTEEKSELKPGDRLDRENGANLGLIMGSKFADYSLEYFEINGYTVYRIIDKDGKQVSEARIPVEYDVCLIVGSKILFVAEYTLPVTATNYSYFDENDNSYKLLDYKSFDILTGAVENVNFNYVIEDFEPIARQSVTDGKLVIERVAVLAMVKEIKNGLLSNNMQVLEIGDNFSVKSDRSETLALCDLDKIIKLADDKYIVNCNDERLCAIVDGFFKNPIYINATVSKVDRQTQSIIVKSDGLYGILDFEGKIKILPAYSYIKNIYDGKATVKLPDKEHEYVIDITAATEEPAIIHELGEFKNENGEAYLIRTETAGGMIEERELKTAHDDATDTDYTYVHVKITDRANTATVLEYNTSRYALENSTTYTSVSAADKDYFIFGYVNVTYAEGNFINSTVGNLYVVVERTVRYTR